MLDQQQNPDMGEQIHPDVLFGILANQTRRSILQTLDSQLVLSKGQLIDLVAEDIHGRDYSTKDRDRIRIEWCHDHKPMLKDHGMITIDNGRVELTDRSQQALELLEVLEGE